MVNCLINLHFLNKIIICRIIFKKLKTKKKKITLSSIFPLKMSKNNFKKLIILHQNNIFQIIMINNLKNYMIIKINSNKNIKMRL